MGTGEGERGERGRKGERVEERGASGCGANAPLEAHALCLELGGVRQTRGPHFPSIGYFEVYEGI